MSGNTKSSGIIKQGIITVLSRGSWGFVETSAGESYFYHLRNCLNFEPVLGAAVTFEVAPPFRIGRPDQAVNLKNIDPDTETIKDAVAALASAVMSAMEKGGKGGVR